MVCPKCGWKIIHGYCGCIPTTPKKKKSTTASTKKPPKSDIPQWKQKRREGNRLKIKTRRNVGK